MFLMGIFKFQIIKQKASKTCKYMFSYFSTRSIYLQHDAVTLLFHNTPPNQPILLDRIIRIMLCQ